MSNIIWNMNATEETPKEDIVDMDEQSKLESEDIIADDDTDDDDDDDDDVDGDEDTPDRIE